MREIIIGVIFVALVITITQVRAGESSSLSDYYSEYTTPVMSIQEKVRQGQRYPGCKPYGDDTVGYFKTREEYINAYDPALMAKEY